MELNVYFTNSCGIYLGIDNFKIKALKPQTALEFWRNSKDLQAGQTGGKTTSDTSACLQNFGIQMTFKMSVSLRGGISKGE